MSFFNYVTNRYDLNTDWEQRKLGEVAIITMGQSPNGKNYTENPKDHILVQGNADMKNGKVVPRIWTTQITKIADKNDIILSVRAPVGDVGTTAYPIVLGRGVAGVKGNNFIFQILHKMKLMNFWRIYSTGSTFDSINSIDLRNATVSVPILKEQEQIGTFLKNLDNTIALHQKGLPELKEINQAFLQGMLSKNNVLPPKIRFATFIGDWEQRKLGEAVSFLNGKAYKQQELLNEGKYRVLRVGNFNTNNKWYYSDLELEENKYANRGDLLYLWATDFKPEIWTHERVIFHYHIWKLVITTTDVDKQFLYVWLMNDREQIKKNTNGTTMVHVTKGNMEQRLFGFPSNEEQVKLGLFFKKFASIIDLHQQKIDKLQQIKKAYLQKMFI